MTSISLNSGLTPQSGVPLPPLDPLVLVIENTDLREQIATLVKAQKLLIDKVQKFEGFFKNSCAKRPIVRLKFVGSRAEISMNQFKTLTSEIASLREANHFQQETIKELELTIRLTKPERIKKLEEQINIKTQELESKIKELEEVTRQRNLLLNMLHSKTPLVQDQVNLLKKEIVELTAKNEQLAQQLNERSQTQAPFPFSTSRTYPLPTFDSLPLTLPADCFSGLSSSIEDPLLSPVAPMETLASSGTPVHHLFSEGESFEGAPT